MAFSFDLKDITQSEQRKIMDKLTFEYKEKDIMKNKRAEDIIPKTLVCYRERDGRVYLPAYWAWKYKKRVNSHDLPAMKYKRIKEPRDEKQANELAMVVDTLRRKRTVALTLRTGAGKTAVSLFAMCELASGITVILLHNDLLCQQWMNSVQKYTT